MRKLLLIALLPLAGCAMNPDQQNQFRENFFRGLGATQPVYQNPGYQMPVNQPRTTVCQRWGQDVICTTR